MASGVSRLLSSHASLFPLFFPFHMLPSCMRSFSLIQFAFYHCISPLFSSQLSPLVHLISTIISLKRKLIRGDNTLFVLAIEFPSRRQHGHRLHQPPTAGFTSQLCNRVCQSQWNYNVPPYVSCMHGCSLSLYTSLNTRPWNTFGDVSDWAKGRIGLMANQCYIKWPIAPQMLDKLTCMQTHMQTEDKNHSRVFQFGSMSPSYLCMKVCKS